MLLFIIINKKLKSICKSGNFKMHSLLPPCVRGNLEIVGVKWISNHSEPILTKYYFLLCISIGTEAKNSNKYIFEGQ